MACYPWSHHRIHSLWRSFNCFGKKSSVIKGIGGKFCNFRRDYAISSSAVFSVKGFSKLSDSVESDVARVERAASDSKARIISGSLTSDTDEVPHLSVDGKVGSSSESAEKVGQDIHVHPVNYTNSSSNTSPNGRVMLIDGTSVIYRAYYKLLAKLQHGYLSHADGNGDWVLTIFTALSLIIDVLEFIPSHVAVVFDYDGLFAELPIDNLRASFWRVLQYCENWTEIQIG